jgi:hypothetical protein
MQLRGSAALELYLAQIERNIAFLGDQISLLRSAAAGRPDVLDRGLSIFQQRKKLAARRLLVQTKDVAALKRWPGQMRDIMSCVPCIVFPSKTQTWMVHVKSRSLGPYRSRDIALQVAVVEAMLLKRSGQPARVTVIADNGAIVVEYCLCANISCEHERHC